MYNCETYKYCTSIVHILYNGRSWYLEGLVMKRLRNRAETVFYASALSAFRSEERFYLFLRLIVRRLKRKIELR